MAKMHTQPALMAYRQWRRCTLNQPLEHTDSGEDAHSTSPYGIQTVAKMHTQPDLMAYRQWRRCTLNQPLEHTDSGEDAHSTSPSGIITVVKMHTQPALMAYRQWRRCTLNQFDCLLQSKHLYSSNHEVHLCNHAQLL